ncbi:hypothetical protein AKG98_1161 [Moritella sp. JT01]|uniref:hypothetical protein n=1 Tax=Moritella sp. JT01 TaxID=756698 RepID=UPI00079BFA67|nr:hypothetical protein [Moritella sp. JT01]KXO09567.1 hypothetical protein AKG98_1161 [Moritella sp. JT01]
MIKKLSLLCISGFIATSAQAGVDIQCNNTVENQPVSFNISSSPYGYKLTSTNAFATPTNTYYTDISNVAGIHQATIRLFTGTERGDTEFSIYYPSVTEKIKPSHEDRKSHERPSEYKVPSLFNNFIVTPEDPEKIHEVPVNEVIKYKVKGYNLASVRYWDGSQGHSYYGCHIVNNPVTNQH